MYITSIDIDTTRRNAKHLLASPQRMHAAVMNACKPSSAETDGRVLWRLDSWPKRTALIILSPTAPDMHDLQEQAGILERGASNWQTHDYTPVMQNISDGDRYRFRLTANPTHTGFVEKTGRKQRLGHVTVAQQLDWLISREDRLGVSFSVDGENTVQLVNRGVKMFKRGQNDVTLTTVTYQGVLVIDNKEMFVQAVAQGIGPAKAYGCGLLTLAPFKERS